MSEAEKLAKFIRREKTGDLFYKEFKGQFSNGFNLEKDLVRIGVVNQTTMLASETQDISDYLKQVMVDTFQPAAIEDHFADTRDTLCYATNDNQSAVSGMLETNADLAVIVGGYNSSNTSHLVELCEEKLPAYFIDSAEKIISKKEIKHYNFHEKKEIVTTHFLPVRDPVRILLTSGASCPDALVEDVINKITGFYSPVRSTKQLIAEFQ
jgi:4-hydroxy-3-methylbut-2-enyl diphosphate reductase